MVTEGGDQNCWTRVSVFSNNLFLKVTRVDWNFSKLNWKYFTHCLLRNYNNQTSRVGRLTIDVEYGNKKKVNIFVQYSKLFRYSCKQSQIQKKHGMFQQLFRCEPDQLYSSLPGRPSVCPKAGERKEKLSEIFRKPFKAFFRSPFIAVGDCTFNSINGSTWVHPY